MECKIVANCKIIEPLVKNYDVDHSYHGLWKYHFCESLHNLYKQIVCQSGNSEGRTLCAINTSINT